MRPKRCLDEATLATKLLAGNLPPDVTDVEIIELFAEAAVRVEVLKLAGESDSITATVNLNVDARTAQVMVDRSKNTYFKSAIAHGVTANPLASAMAARVARRAESAQQKSSAH